jgi:hypothetical protein
MLRKETSEVMRWEDGEPQNQSTEGERGKRICPPIGNYIPLIQNIFCHFIELAALFYGLLL